MLQILHSRFPCTTMGDGSVRACLQACKACATECAADAAEGACEHQMGLLAQKKGDFTEALRCQQAFLELSSQVRDHLPLPRPLLHGHSSPKHMQSELPGFTRMWCENVTCTLTFLRLWPAQLRCRQRCACSLH